MEKEVTTHNIPKAQSERYVFLDFLRFILAAIVVLFHYFSLILNGVDVPGIDMVPRVFYVYGYLGVQVFFILSGFVILHTALTRNWWDFIKARVGRLLPGLMIVSLIGYLIAFVLPGDGRATIIYFKDFIANFSGLAILPKFNTFFGTSFIDGSMWSLCYEVWFYVFVTFILFFKKIQNLHFFVYGWILISIIINEVAFVPKGLAGFFITDYSFFFAIGILTYMILKDIAVQFKNWHYLYLAMSIFFAGRAVYLQALGFELAHKNSSWSAVFFFLFFVILFFIGINLHYSKKWFIKLSGVLGGASYILYLIHQFIGYRIAHYFSYWTIYHSFGLLFVMMIVAIILHLFLEKRVAGYIKIVLSKINL